ncbi:MAG: hypothetical protein HW374_1216, partial [Bacteroidetes bacterium]|nr:hypothetical protein [Bacteroidota bacterium]
MRKIICILCFLSYVSASAQDQEPRKDTVYYLSPVVVTAIQAFERLSPVVFSDLTRLEIKQRYSVQDVP